MHRRRALVLLGGGLLSGCGRWSRPSPELVLPACTCIVYEPLHVVGEYNEIAGLVTMASTRERVELAAVVLQSAQDDVERAAVTDRDGLYVFQGLPPGRYDVFGFYGKGQRTRELTLPAYSSARVDLVLDDTTVLL